MGDKMINIDDLIKHREINSIALKDIPLTYWNRIDYQLEDRKSYSLEQIGKIENTGAVIKNITFDNIKFDNRLTLDKYLNKINEIFINSGYYIESTKNQSTVRISYNAQIQNPHIIDYNLIKVKENESLTIILDYNSIENINALRNSIFKIDVEENANLELVFIQRLGLDAENFSEIIIDQKAYSQVKEYFIDLGSFITGTSNKVYLEENAKSETYSLYLADKERKVDLEFSNFHKGRRSESIIEGRGIVKDKSKKVFRGNLKFEKGSSKSVGKESEYAILLDKTVKASSIPTLKCDEDDVIGEHAASAGQIDKNKLFYLTSRGLSPKEAEKLIILSNFKPILEKIGDKILEKTILEEIEKRV